MHSGRPRWCRGCRGAEDIGEVSRQIRVAAPELECLEGGEKGLKAKHRPGGELMRTRAKRGEMTMRVELQAELLKTQAGTGTSWGSSRGAWTGGSGNETELTMVREAWRVAWSSVYASWARLGGPLTSDGQTTRNARPRETAMSDEELVDETWTVLNAGPFLRKGPPEGEGAARGQGIRVGKNRVLRLMRAHGLLAPAWRGKGDRYAALEPARKGSRPALAASARRIARCVGPRHDGGSQYTARQSQAEIKWPGIRSTPAYPRVNVGWG